jgi:Fe-S-cluster-containing dehydrogenase component
MEETLSESRRKFLGQVVAGTATATILMVSRPFASEGEHGAVSKDLKAVVGELEKHDYAYVVDIGNCIGCGSCVRGCGLENGVPASLFRTWVERYVRVGQRVYVDSPDGAKNGFKPIPAEIVSNTDRAWFTPKLCNHCRKAPCVQVCPVGATFKAPGGFVLVDPDHCIACGYCVQACPYGARFINPVTHVADKCTWCYHRVVRGKLPACVTVCPKKARLFGDLNDPESEVSKIIKADRWLVLKPEMHTSAYCFYVGLPREVV